MSISNAEEQLFARWRESRADLVPDGVVNEQAYLRSDPKVLFVLKEVNDRHGSLRDLRDFLKRGGKGPTWNPIARWITGIRRLPERTPLQDVEKKIGETFRIQALQSIAAMNLKKSPGGGSTEYPRLEAAATEDADLLAEQFLLYDADLVICCGDSVDKLVDKFRLDEGRAWQSTTSGVRYKEYKEGKFIISSAHPQVRRRKDLLFYGLVDTIAELRHKGGG